MNSLKLIYSPLVLIASMLLVQPGKVRAAEDYLPRPVDQEIFADGSIGWETEFRGVGGVAIPAYVRKPAGDGPFPMIVLLHGGKYGHAVTMATGRSLRSPLPEFIAAGFAIYSIDYRPIDKVAVHPIEFDDSVEAVKTVKKLPFVDPTMVGLFGGSHGAQVSSRVVSRTDVSGAVLCAPAALDFIEIKKAGKAGEPVVGILHRMIANVEAELGASMEEIATDPAKYGYSSAITEAANARAPILIINGRNDDNSPIPVLNAYVAKLRAAGKSVETYFPDNGPHGFYWSRPDIPEAKESARRAVKFFQNCFGQEIGANLKRNNPANYDYGPMEWVDPDKTEPEGMHYKTFFSKTISQDVSYLVYFPPNYNEDRSTRFPVVYNLPASGQTPQSGGGFVKGLDTAIRAGKADPMIVVSVNGLRGNTMYSNSRDGLYPLETVIIKDLIPHVDTTYRTQVSRDRRAVEGFSMGGFGAAHLGFKFPELFGIISIQAPALLGPYLRQPRPTQAWSRLFPNAMGGDMDYWLANDPFELISKNADALRDRTLIRIICHIEPENWMAPQCERMHQVLMENNIQHTFSYFSNVKAHSRGQVISTLGDSAFNFFSSTLPKPADRLKPLAPIDPMRGRQLMEKSSRGETLNIEEQVYLERVKVAIRERSGGQNNSQASTPKPQQQRVVNPDDWVDLIPITDMTKPYKGEDGGLYGDGKNEPPKAHQAAYFNESQKIRPLDADGRSSKDGKIGLITIGFSNTSIESNGFKKAADADPQKSPQVIVVNGSIGGRSAVMWAWDGSVILPKPEQERLDQTMDLLGMPKTKRRSSPNLDRDTWPTLGKRIGEAGLSALQVQACWLKHVEANPKPLGEFPDHARTLQKDITAILQIAKHHYPNLRVVYLSSRTFGGWSGRVSGSPEPYAYESGFGTRWVVQSQINGDQQLNFDPARGEVKAPLVLWGPYLWAQGDSPRTFDGMTWTKNDVRADMLHPNEAGTNKTTTLLMNFFKTNEATSRWYLKSGEIGEAIPLPK